MRRALVLAAMALAAGSCGDGDPAFEPQEVGELTLPARVSGPSIEAAAPNGFVKLFWAGVNLGSTIPARQPGEVAATREDYDRWLDGMGELGVRVVRIYTILRPAFYDALDDYNEDHADQPIFFMQGVWVPDEERAHLDGRRLRPGRRRRGSGPRSRMPSPSSTATPSCRSGPATRAGDSAATSPAGCWRSRSASNGTRMRCARPTARTPAGSRLRDAISAPRRMRPRWRAGSPRCSTTRRRTTPSAAGAGR